MFVWNAKNFLISIITLCLLSLINPIYANQSLLPFEKANWFMGINIGGYQTYLPSNTYVSNGTPVPAPYNLDHLTINQAKWQGLIGVLAGYQVSTNQAYLPYASLAIQYTYQVSNRIKGSIYQYSLPQFKNYSYHLDLNSDVVTLVAKLDLLQFHCVMPYISIGLGTAFNTLGNFAETPLSGVYPARIDPDYGNKTNRNFAYTMGAGFDLILDGNIWATFGYEFADLGKVKTGKGSSTWSETLIDLGKIKRNAIIASIIYQF